MDEVKQEEGEERDCMKHADDIETETETRPVTEADIETETDECVRGCNSTLIFINILPTGFITHYALKPFE